MNKMDLKEFLDSGLLELFVIGSLSPDETLLVRKMQAAHPTVQKEIEKLEEFYERLALKSEIEPSLRTQIKMETLFSNLALEEEMNLADTPLISGFSNSEAWLKLVAPLFPKVSNGKRFQKLLRNDNGVMQMLVISPTKIEEEIHDDLEESFLILEGTCVCTIGNTSRNMGPGDFMQIPLFETHTVTITSPTVTAILQRVDL